MPPWKVILLFECHGSGPKFESIEMFGLVITGGSKVQMTVMTACCFLWPQLDTVSRETPLASQRCLKCRSERCLIHKWIYIKNVGPLENPQMKYDYHAQTHSAKTPQVLPSVSLLCLKLCRQTIEKSKLALVRVRKITLLIQFRSAQHFQS